MVTGAIMQTFGGLIKRLAVLLMSMIPFVGNRGSILMAAALNLKWYVAFIGSTVGSFIPVPFVMKKSEQARKKLMNYKSSAKLLNRVNTFTDKYRAQLSRHGYLVLFLTIAIPFTGIGCWEGALVADVIGLDRKKSCLALFLAQCVSSAIFVCTVYGLLAGVKSLFRSVKDFLFAR